MTTLTPTQPPVLCYEIWEYNNEIRGHIIDHIPYWKCKNSYAYYYDVQGRTAHYVIVSHDGSIGRSEAIAFAKACHENKIIRSHVDLAPCQPNRKK